MRTFQYRYWRKITGVKFTINDIMPQEVPGYGYQQSSANNYLKYAKVVDLRSDTISLPTPGMRDAIVKASVGDAVYGEDPTVLELEKRTAALLGKEDGVFVPSGTMSNLAAILVHCEKRDSEIITGNKSHILLFEQTGVAQFGGINIREIENKPDGTFDLDELQSKIREIDLHNPITSLICIENTHNVLGGKVLPMEWIEKVGKFAKLHNLPIHMDGARVFNAAVKLNVPVSKIVEHMDSVSVCFSKSLGGPYGSVLVGSENFIIRARRAVKALGGGIRQGGFMAAAGLYALDNMINRLVVDHEHIQKIANAIRDQKNPNVVVAEPNDIHTNILIIKLNSEKTAVSDFLQELNSVSEKEENPVIIRAFGIDGGVRLVTSINNSPSDIEDAIEKIKLVVNRFK